MRKLSFLFISILVTLSALADGEAPYSGSRIFWDSSTRSTVFGNGGYARICELQDGRLMACCESNGINIAFSTNKGSSWSSPQKIVSNSNNTPNAVPDLIQLKDGTIIVAYNPRPNTPYTTDRKFGIRCKRSTDNGATWSQEIFVYDAQHTFEDGCWEPSMLELPSGELQLYFANEGPFTSSGEQEISMCRSFDGGQTWGNAQRICFRAGFRDGMPVPVLLKDEQTIVVAIEDNGWGYGNFYPTTVRCPLSKNWNNYWVNASSSNRQKPFDYSYCPGATGGAPYLCVLPWGETVLSWQSTHNHGSNNSMLVAIGDENAQNFKGMRNPFVVPESQSCLWNSVCSIDTGIVVAVGGINGSIEMIKGYPRKELFASYGQPQIDGVLTKKEGYHFAAADQVLLGCEFATRTNCDFAYDRDSLYLLARVADRTQYAANTTNSDGITLELDFSGQCASKPMTGCWRIFFGLYGNIVVYAGNDNRVSWQRQTSFTGPRSVTVAKSTNYVIEAAIPWSALGIDFPPVDQALRINLQLNDAQNSNNNILQSTIPDADLNKPYTWMAFRLLPSEELARIEPVKIQKTDDGYYDMSGRRQAAPAKGVYIHNGRKILKR